MLSKGETFGRPWRLSKIRYPLQKLNPKQFLFVGGLLKQSIKQKLRLWICLVYHSFFFFCKLSENSDANANYYCRDKKREKPGNRELDEKIVNQPDNDHIYYEGKQS